MARKKEKKSPAAESGHSEFHRVKLSCRIGRDALEGKSICPPGVFPVEYALFNLLHAVEDLAEAIQKTALKTTARD